MLSSKTGKEGDETPEGRKVPGLIRHIPKAERHPFRPVQHAALGGALVCFLI